MTDLDIARRMAEAGIPLFVAERDPAGIGHSNTGFWLPKGWVWSQPDVGVVDRWAPGMALCAVGGWGPDFLDIDTRHGGHESYAALNGTAPVTLNHPRGLFGGWLVSEAAATYPGRSHVTVNTKSQFD